MVGISAKTSLLSQVQKYAVSVGIAAYLAVLGYGVLLHTFDLPGKQTVPGYLVVWDMYCGWSGYERRLHFVAQGQSGTFYDCSDVPGKTITPHGDTPRRNFDFQNQFCGKLAADVLARTAHEPINRIFVLEQNWPKRFNVPAVIRPELAMKERPTYWHAQAVYTPDGEIVDAKPLWIAVQGDRAIFDNPRLLNASQRRVTLVSQSN